jgi:hypothetical protein
MLNLATRFDERFEMLILAPDIRSPGSCSGERHRTVEKASKSAIDPSIR